MKRARVPPNVDSLYEIYISTHHYYQTPKYVRRYIVGLGGRFYVEKWVLTFWAPGIAGMPYEQLHCLRKERMKHLRHMPEEQIAAVKRRRSRGCLFLKSKS